MVTALLVGFEPRLPEHESEVSDPCTLTLGQVLFGKGISSWNVTENNI